MTIRLLVLTSLVVGLTAPAPAQTSSIRYVPMGVGQIVEEWDGNCHKIVRIPLWGFPSGGGAAPEFTLKFPAQMYGTRSHPQTMGDVHVERGKCEVWEGLQRETVRGRTAYVWYGQTLAYSFQLLAGAGSFYPIDQHSLNVTIQVSPESCLWMSLAISQGGAEPDSWQVQSEDIAAQVNDSWWDEGEGIELALRRLFPAVICPGRSDRNACGQQRFGGLRVPALAAGLGSDLADGTEGGPRRRDGLWPGITAGTSNPAVVEREAPRLGKRDKRIGTQAEVAPGTFDHNAQPPGARFLDRPKPPDRTIHRQAAEPACPISICCKVHRLLRSASRPALVEKRLNSPAFALQVATSRPGGRGRRICFKPHGGNGLRPAPAVGMLRACGLARKRARESVLVGVPRDSAAGGSGRGNRRTQAQREDRYACPK